MDPGRRAATAVRPLRDRLGVKRLPRPLGYSEVGRDWEAAGVGTARAWLAIPNAPGEPSMTVPSGDGTNSLGGAQSTRALLATDSPAGPLRQGTDGDGDGSGVGGGRGVDAGDGWLGGSTPVQEGE